MLCDCDIFIILFTVITYLKIEKIFEYYFLSVYIFNLGMREAKTQILEWEKESKKSKITHLNIYNFFLFHIL